MTGDESTAVALRGSRNADEGHRAADEELRTADEEPRAAAEENKAADEGQHRSAYDEGLIAAMRVLEWPVKGVMMGLQ